MLIPEDYLGTPGIRTKNGGQLYLPRNYLAQLRISEVKVKPSGSHQVPEGDVTQT
ncbi:hypothetical protein JYU34_020121 [Plutella xylostella]|uniref:Uncharacterized protein n=1 Tax=Plutella xylostella TaxID=51655 RepID=A0ABQ7PXG7_PLUXY|nr:hypothetical protein JYU34_020121 [Plutella xylostella]